MPLEFDFLLSPSYTPPLGGEVDFQFSTTAIYSYTGTGQLTFSGTAPLKIHKSYQAISNDIVVSSDALYSREYSYSPTGQITISGEATTGYGTYYVASGQIQTSGSADEKVNYKIVSSGQITTSNSASIAIEKKYRPTGTVNVSGSATVIFNKYYYTGSGTVNTSGSALYSVNNRYYTGSGTLNTSGQALYSINNRYYTGSGSINVSGQALCRMNNTYYAASGTIYVSGQATDSINNRYYTGSGTIQTSGTALYSFNDVAEYSYTGSGTIQTSGTALYSFVSNNEYSYTGSGTIQTSGTALYSFNDVTEYPYTGSGTIQIDGQALISQTFSYGASGQITISNEATTSQVISYRYTPILNDIHVSGTYLVKRDIVYIPSGIVNVSGVALVEANVVNDQIFTVGGNEIDFTINSVTVFLGEENVKLRHAMHYGKKIEFNVGFVTINIENQDMVESTEDPIIDIDKDMIPPFNINLNDDDDDGFDIGGIIEDLAPLVPIGLAASYFIGTDKEKTDCASFKLPSDILDFIPSFEEIHAMFVAAFKVPISVLTELAKNFPPFDLTIKFPNIPSLADWKRALGDIEMPSVAAAYAALATFATQLLNVLKEIADKIFTFIGDIPFPKLPILDIDLKEFFTLKPFDLIAKLKIKFPNIMDLIPEFPEIFKDFSNTLMEYATLLMMGMVNYVKVMIDFVVGVIKKFLDYLEKLEIDFPDFPDLPKIPTFDEIMAAIKSKLSVYGDTISEMLSELGGDFRKILDAFRNLSFPDFDFSLPDPLFPKFDIPAVELVYSYGSMIAQFFASIIQKLKDYVDKLPLLSDIIDWPNIKDWFKAMKIPTFCVTDLNEKIKEEESNQRLEGGNMSPVDKDDIFENLNS